jgi:hypothetical protein
MGTRYRERREDQGEDEDVVDRKRVCDTEGLSR